MIRIIYHLIIGLVYLKHIELNFNYQKMLSLKVIQITNKFSILIFIIILRFESSSNLYEIKNKTKIIKFLQYINPF